MKLVRKNGGMAAIFILANATEYHQIRLAEKPAVASWPCAGIKRMLPQMAAMGRQRLAGLAISLAAAKAGVTAHVF